VRRRSRAERGPPTPREGRLGAWGDARPCEGTALAPPRATCLRPLLRVPAAQHPKAHRRPKHGPLPRPHPTRQPPLPPAQAVKRRDAQLRLAAAQPFGWVQPSTPV